MSLIEDLSNPLSRLIVYLCLSLIGLKRELSPWSIQRRAKSNHFSLCLSFFVYVFLSSSFCCSLSPLILSLSLPPSFCLSHSSYPSPQISSHDFVLSALLSSLSHFSPPNWSFSLHSCPCLALLISPPLASLCISFRLSPLSSPHFSPTATSHTSSQKQLVHLKEQLGLGKVHFVCIVLQKETKQLVQTEVFFSLFLVTNITIDHLKKFKALQYRVSIVVVGNRVRQWYAMISTVFFCQAQWLFLRIF